MKHLKINIILILCFCFSVVSQAQDLAYNHKDLPCVEKHYNIFVHISVDSLRNTGMSVETIQDAIAEANVAFAPICISFEMCKLDTMYNYKLDSLDSPLEVQEVKNLYGQDNRINLFLHGKHYNPGLCGFANLAGANSPKNADVFVLKPCGAGTLIHELGHLFGLSHTFGSRTELVNGSNCLDVEDKICDTPADPYIVGDSMSWYIGPNCEFIYIKNMDENGEWYQPDVGNYMSYYPCSCGFTREQYLKMVETYHLSPIKNW